MDLKKCGRLHPALQLAMLLAEGAPARKMRGKARQRAPGVQLAVLICLAGCELSSLSNSQAAACV